MEEVKEVAIAGLLADMRDAIFKEKDKKLVLRYIESGPDPEYWSEKRVRERPVRIYHRAIPRKKGLARCGAEIPGPNCLYFNNEQAARLFGFQRCTECPWD
jgi:hypothetical protein